MPWFEISHSLLASAFSKPFNINGLGRYHFELSPNAAGGDLRPLGDPKTMDVLELLWKD